MVPTMPIFSCRMMSPSPPADDCSAHKMIRYAMLLIRLITLQIAGQARIRCITRCCQDEESLMFIFCRKRHAASRASRRLD